MAWQIDKVLSQFSDEIEEVMDIAAELTVGEMKKSATFFGAVDTGNYRDSFDWRRISSNVRRVFNPVEYAIWIELGTRRMTARPVMRLGLLNAKNLFG